MGKMKNIIVVFVGSYTIKAYKKDSEILLKKSMLNIIDKEISTFEYASCLMEYLINFLNDLKKKIECEISTSEEVKIEFFASSVFKKLYGGAYRAFINEFYINTTYYFNILDNHVETLYLKHSLDIKPTIKKYYVLKIGGNAIEIIFINSTSFEIVTLEFGTSSLIKEYPTLISPDFINVTLFNEVKAYVSKKTDDRINEFKIRCANDVATSLYYLGGELEFLESIKCDINKKKQPYKVDVEDFERAITIFCQNMKLSDICNYESNKEWLTGSKACSIIALSLFEKLNIETVFPRNEDLADGIFDRKYALMTVLSDKCDNILKKIIDEHEKNKIICLNVLEKSEWTPYEIYDFISISDVVYVYNKNNICNSSQLLFLGYAFALSKKVLFFKKPDNEITEKFPMEYDLF